MADEEADDPAELRLHLQRTAQLGALTLLVKAIVKRSENRPQIADLFRNIGRDCVDEIRRGGLPISAELADEFEAQIRALQEGL